MNAQRALTFSTLTLLAVCGCAASRPAPDDLAATTATTCGWGAPESAGSTNSAPPQPPRIGGQGISAARWWAASASVTSVDALSCVNPGLRERVSV